MNLLLTCLGTILNLVSGVLLIIPLLSVCEEGKWRRKSTERIKDETATKCNSNPSLANDLIFTRNCASVALILLIIGTTLLLLELIL